jgi:hypothetical protein
MPQGATKPVPRDQLLSLPSLANSLCSLPQATAMSNVAVHTNFTTTIQHNADGNAKVCFFASWVGTSANRLPTVTKGSADERHSWLSQQHAPSSTPVDTGMPLSPCYFFLDAYNKL